MKAMVLEGISNINNNVSPLKLAEFPEPDLQSRDILVKVSVCGVCHTELDEIEGRIVPLNLPLIPGHQVVGKMVKKGKKVKKMPVGGRVGIGWIYHTCGKCRFCLTGKENLCRDFKATGRDYHGGYAEYIKVSEDFAYLIPAAFSDAEAAPLLCAGAIGYRSLKLAKIEDGMTIGFTGFGASAHIAIQIAGYIYPSSRIFVFARSEKERRFAEELGAYWTGTTEAKSPEKLDCIIDTTPAWKPVLHALESLQSSGRLIINAIQKEERDKENLLKINYTNHLWLEKEIKTVANVTRNDIEECLKVAAEIKLKPEFQEFPLKDANYALKELKERKIRGAKVLRVAFTP